MRVGGALQFRDINRLATYKSAERRCRRRARDVARDRTNDVQAERASSRARFDSVWHKCKESILNFGSA